MVREMRKQLNGQRYEEATKWSERLHGQEQRDGANKSDRIVGLCCVFKVVVIKIELALTKCR